jgi:hypothetical protein
MKVEQQQKPRGRRQGCAGETSADTDGPAAEYRDDQAGPRHHEEGVADGETITDRFAGWGLNPTLVRRVPRAYGVLENEIESHSTGNGQQDVEPHHA